MLIFALHNTVTFSGASSQTKSPPSCKTGASLKSFPSPGKNLPALIYSVEFLLKVNISVFVKASINFQLLKTGKYCASNLMYKFLSSLEPFATGAHLLFTARKYLPLSIGLSGF